MQYTTLGKSNLMVSKVCLGCMGFGDPAAGQHSWTIGETDTTQIIQRALELGINFFDTAIGYQNGTSEQYVGKALRSATSRDSYVIATKFLPRTSEEIDIGVNGVNHVKNSLDQSLKNLGMDYVDLYIYHMWDYHTPMEEIMEGLHRVVKAGKARYIGISNCYAWQLAKANAYARAKGYPEFISVQNHYNLIFREEEREMIPFCREEQIGITPYSALAGGRLAKPLGEVTFRLKSDYYARSKYEKTAQQDGEIIRRTSELAQKRGVSMTEIAVAWLIAKSDSPIVGATRLSQLEGITRAAELQLTAEEMYFLEELYVPHALVGVMAQNKA